VLTDCPYILCEW